MTDAWWHADGVVKWAVNPGGQLVELRYRHGTWEVTLHSPFGGIATIPNRTDRHDEAIELFDVLAQLTAPAARAALDEWRRERGKRAHPAQGEEGQCDG